MTTTRTPAAPDVQAVFDLAVEHHLAGRIDPAIAAYRDALALAPQLAAAMNNLGALLAPLGQVSDALALFRRAVTADPGYGEAQNNLGLALANTGRHDEAVIHFQAAVKLEPRRALWWNNLGNSQVERFHFAEALAAYDRAVAIDPASADAWSNRGLALRGLRRPDDAIASFERALAADPRFANALVNLGIVLKEEKRIDEAIAAFEKARALRPNDSTLLCNFASVFEVRGEFDRMRELADAAAALDPQSAEPYVLRGNHAMAAGRYIEAEAEYERARALDTENRNANWNLALIWLLRGDYARGWAQFEWRKRLQSVLLDHRELGGEPWTGDALDGRTILLHAEQGLGDALQFVRYAEVLEQRGAGRVVVEAPAAIADLLASARGVDAVVVRGAPLPTYDAHASLMDLPRLCGTELETVPAAVPYLEASPRPVSALVNAPPAMLKVGIVWAGNPAHQRDHLRSVPLAQIATLFDHPGVRFFSLQKGGPERELAALAGDRVVDLAPHLADFRDTAAAIARLDLVLTVDTSVAHLAGALGRETWVMITHVPDFRWLLDRTDSPWYPTARLFRQPAPRDWVTVIASVRQALDGRLGMPKAASSPALDAEPLINLASAARRADGRPRFELSIPLAELARSDAFAAYELELLGVGHEAAARAFLDEAMSDGDVLLDPAPGIGITALSVATSPAPRGTAHVVEADPARAERLRRATRDVGVSERLTIHSRVPNERDLGMERGTEAGAHTAAGRIFLRIGDSGRTPELLAEAAADGALDIAAVIWPSAPPAMIAPALQVLERHGFWVAAVTLADGEATLDPIADRATAQTIVALDQPLLVALTGASPEAARVGRPIGEPAAPRWLAIDWEVRGDTGWGVYGLNLATHLALGREIAPVLLACEEGTLPPLARHRLQAALAASAPAARALADGTSVVTVEGTLLRAFGNGFTGASHGDRLRARRDVGVVFFEDTHVPADGLARARALDLVIAGSTWNAEVLRASGLENVRMVTQGIDPAIFHPAPRTGLFGDRFVIFSGGKLEYRKGQDIVVAAFRRFRERYPDALLLTAWHNHWPQLIADLELAGHVRDVPGAAAGSLRIAEWLAANGVPAEAVVDVGCTPNAFMGQVVREADVALFPNRCEGGTNLVAMECMAAGIPTIVSANTGHGDLIATGGCFVLRRQRAVRPPTRYYRGIDGWGESDVDEIVALLERLYADRALASARADVGAAAMQKLTWRAQVGVLLAAIGA